MKTCFFIAFCMMAIAGNAQDTTYKEMLGKYKFPAGSIIDEANVTLENGALTMSSSAGVSVLERIKGDTFNVVSFNGICIFTRNEAKKINGVHVDASGYILDGVKDADAVTIEDATFFMSKHAELAIAAESMAASRSHRFRAVGSIVP